MKVTPANTLPANIAGTSRKKTGVDELKGNGFNGSIHLNEPIRFEHIKVSSQVAEVVHSFTSTHVLLSVERE